MANQTTIFTPKKLTLPTFTVMEKNLRHVDDLLDFQGQFGDLKVNLKVAKIIFHDCIGSENHTRQSLSVIAIGTIFSRLWT